MDQLLVEHDKGGRLCGAGALDPVAPTGQGGKYQLVGPGTLRKRVDGLFEPGDPRQRIIAIDRERPAPDALGQVAAQPTMQHGEAAPHRGDLTHAEVGSLDLVARCMRKERVETPILLGDRRAAGQRQRRDRRQARCTGIGDHRMLLLDQCAVAVAIRAQRPAARCAIDQQRAVDCAGARQPRGDDRADRPCVEQGVFCVREHEIT
jgi:hypothetical protein